MDAYEKALKLQAIREEEHRLAEEARQDTVPVPPGTPRFGAFAEDNPAVHQRYANPHNPEASGGQ